MYVGNLPEYYAFIVIRLFDTIFHRRSKNIDVIGHFDTYYVQEMGQIFSFPLKIGTCGQSALPVCLIFRPAPLIRRKSMGNDCDQSNILQNCNKGTIQYFSLVVKLARLGFLIGIQYKDQKLQNLRGRVIIRQSMDAWISPIVSCLHSYHRSFFLKVISTSGNFNIISTKVFFFVMRNVQEEEIN